MVRGPMLPSEFLGPCPWWCGGVHAGEEAWGIAQFHETQPLVLSVELGGLDYEIAEAVIVQYQGERPPEERLPYIALDLGLEGLQLGPEDVERVVLGLESYLPRLRELAAHLAEIRERDQGDKP